MSRRKEEPISDGEEWPGLRVVRGVTEGRPLMGTWFDRTYLYEENRRWQRLRLENSGPRPKAQDFAE